MPRMLRYDAVLSLPKDTTMIRFFAAPFLLFTACGGSSSDDSTDSAITCENYFCGCSEEISIDFTTTVWNGQLDAPVEGATLTCKNEDSPRGTSGVDGIIAFQLDTTESEGCGLEDCENVIIAAAEAGLVSQELNYLEALNQVVTLQYGED